MTKYVNLIADYGFREDVKRLWGDRFKQKRRQTLTQEERIFSGRLFASEEPELVEKKLKSHRLSQEYNQSFEEDVPTRERILHELLDEVGEGTFMLGPIHFHYGSHTKIGKHHN